jgi:hypothetical protein
MIGSNGPARLFITVKVATWQTVTLELSGNAQTLQRDWDPSELLHHINHNWDTEDIIVYGTVESTVTEHEATAVAVR